MLIGFHCVTLLLWCWVLFLCSLFELGWYRFLQQLGCKNTHFAPTAKNSLSQTTFKPFPSWKYVLSLRRWRQSGQAVGKPTDLVRLELTTMPFAFRGHLLYHWATSPYWTSRLSCHLVQLEVSSCLIHYCQLRVIQLVPLVCWRPPTTTPTVSNFDWEAFK